MIITKEIFKEKYIPEPMSGCWIWTGSIDKDKYGQTGKQEIPGIGYSSKAHRISWMLYRGLIPVGHSVCHRCDIPSCVNPDHLFVGTQLDNMRDCRSKKRKFKDNAYTNSRLKAEHVISIVNDKRSPLEIAASFGIARETVYGILHGRRWGHLTGRTCHR